jgi:hypothetical protein
MRSTSDGFTKGVRKEQDSEGMKEMFPSTREFAVPSLACVRRLFPFLTLFFFGQMFPLV